jgi:hypothetical protein
MMARSPNMRASSPLLVVAMLAALVMLATADDIFGSRTTVELSFGGRTLVTMSKSCPGVVLEDGTVGPTTSVTLHRTTSFVWGKDRSAQTVKNLGIVLDEYPCPKPEPNTCTEVA